jgi:hypothetical protein
LPGAIIRATTFAFNSFEYFIFTHPRPYFDPDSTPGSEDIYPDIGGADEHIALLATAGRQGLLKAAYSGGVLELAFPGFLKNDETRCIP